MKKIIITIIISAGISMLGFSQKAKHHPSYIGISIQPSHYWLYNKDEFTAPDTIFGVKNDSVFINGFAGGLSYGHFLKKKFGVNIQLLYSTQTQYYKYDYAPGLDYGEWECSTNLKYIKLPIFFTHRKELSGNKFLTFSYGIQSSYLFYTYEFSHNYQTVPSKYDYKLIRKNNTSQTLVFDEIIPAPDSLVYFYDWRYKRVVFGANLSAGYEQYINNNMSFNIAINADYDITNIDNTGALKYTYEKTETGELNRYYPIKYPRFRTYRHSFFDSLQYDRKPSHNIHLGLEFGFKYWFGEKALHIERKIPREW